MFVYIRSAAFIIVVTQKIVLQQSKNVTAKCTETLSPPPCIQFSLIRTMSTHGSLLRIYDNVRRNQKHGYKSIFGNASNLTFFISCLKSEFVF